MKIFINILRIKLISFILLLIITFSFNSFASTIEISSGCVTGTATLTEGVGLIDGKNFFEGTGNIFGYSNIAVSIWWDATESLWILGLDGQPYWTNSDDTSLPNSTLLSGNWTQVDFSEGNCDPVVQGDGTNKPIGSRTWNGSA